MGDMADMAARHQVWLPRLRAPMLAAQPTSLVCVVALVAVVAAARVVQQARDAADPVSRSADDHTAKTDASARTKSAHSTDAVSRALTSCHLACLKHPKPISHLATGIASRSAKGIWRPQKDFTFVVTTLSAVLRWPGAPLIPSVGQR